MKKIIAIAMLVILTLTAVVGGTLAYFTDTDSDVNVMTVGNVQVELVEQQRKDGADSDLEPFEDNKALSPLVGSAQGDKDDWGMPVAKNYVDKIVSAKNTGVSDAYMRIIVAVPAALEGETDDPSTNALHWNLGNRFDVEEKGTWNESWNIDGNPYSKDYITESAPNGYTYAGTTTIDDIEYNMYVFTCQNTVAKGESTAVAITGFYLDSEVEYDADRQVYTLNGKVIDYDLSQGVKIPVYVQAAQVDGFENAETALNTAFYEVSSENNPWTSTTMASSEEDLTKGGSIDVVEDIELTAKSTPITENSNINLNGFTVSASRTASSAEESAVLAIYSDVVLSGDGTVSNDKDYVITVGQKDGAEGNLVITGGNYTGVTTAVNVVKGTVVITGGTFEVKGSSYGSTYLINCYDANYKDGTAKVEIKGGTFVNWDPSNNTAEGQGTNFVADGYKVVKETVGDVTWYTVVAE